MNRLLVIALLMLSFGWTAHAADTSHKDLIRTQIKRVTPKADITSIKDTPINGLYEVLLDGVDILYVSADGKHFINGHLYANQKNGMVDLTEKRLSMGRGDKLKTVSDKGMIVYSPEGKTKGVVYAFTDVDCGYCKKFHREVPALNDLGVEVRYLAWPRSGLGANSVTYKKMQKVWCSTDRQTALTETKLQNKVPTDVADCETAIPKHFKLGFQLGVKGTPALFSEDGRQVGGYRKADELARDLGVM